MNILITGGAGFIGHHLIDYLLTNTQHYITTLDRLGKSGTLHRLHAMPSWPTQAHRVRVVLHDLRSPINQHVAARLGSPDLIFHLAAASHVDDSILRPAEFVLDNVLGTTHIMDWARALPALQRFFYFSTDEVFGAAPAGTRYKEWAHYASGNPYAASKAGAEEMALAFCNTYKLPVVITHTMNVFGERQQPDKFIPGTVKKVLRGEKVIIHANPARTCAGSRFYIWAKHVASALCALTTVGNVGDKYNIVGQREWDNLDLARFIATTLERELKYELVDFHSSRPGHDLRYALDGSKLAELGWWPPEGCEESMRKVVLWMAQHPDWLY